MNKYYILAIVCLVIFFAGLSYTGSQTQTEKGDCYDNRDHKIDELTCDVIRYKNPWIGIISVISLMGSIVLLFLGLMGNLEKRRF